MDEAIFWQIVDRAHLAAVADMDKKCRVIVQEISTLSTSDALAFARLFDMMMGKAYQWPLWGAAYVINGGCGDDTFEDFCASLISRGRDAYESALSAPDSLEDAEFDEGAWFYEGYQYAIAKGVEAVVGAKPPPSRQAAVPSGPSWQEDEVYGLFPRLAAKFG